MPLKNSFVLALLALSIGMLHAQIQGVVSGHVIDPQSGSIRALLGIPGAARLGNPSDLGFRISYGAVRNGRAVVISAEEPPQAYSIQISGGAQNLGGAPQVKRLPISPTPTGRVFLNPSATLALLYSADAQQFQFVKGLDPSPHTLHSIHSFHASVLRGTFVDAALADSTSCALIASSDESASYIQKVCSGISISFNTVTILPGTHISSVAWFHREADAIAADQTGNRILLIPSIGEGLAPVELNGSDQGVQSPTALLPLDNARIAVISSGTSTLLVLDTQHLSQPRAIALPTTPTRLELLDSTGILALTGTDSGPLLLVDIRQDFAPFFVPVRVPAN